MINRTQPYSPQEQSLDLVRENMVAIASYADAGAAFTDARDTPGLSYSIRKIIAHLKVAAATTRDLIGADTETKEGA